MKLNRRYSLLIAFTIICSSLLIAPSANAEQLKRYKIVTVDGDVLGIVEGYPSYYTGRVTWWVTSNNTVQAAAELARITTQWNADATNDSSRTRCLPCTYVLDSFQQDTDQGTPSTPTTTPTTKDDTAPTAPTTTAPTTTAPPSQGNLSAIEIELYSVGQSDIQWTINASAGGSPTVLYSNFSYTWSLSGSSGVIESGSSGNYGLSNSTAGQIASFHAKNLLQGTTYVVSVTAINAGSELRATRSITTKNQSATSTPTPKDDSTTQKITDDSTQTVTAVTQDASNLINDGTLERICLPLGWSTCGEWTIYDLKGIQKNRVVGPTPLASLLTYVRCQTSGLNLCGDNSSVPLGTVVQTGTYVATTPTITPTTTPPLVTTKDDTTSTTSPLVTTEFTSDTRNGLGGYAVIHPTGYVCGVIVGNAYFGSNDKTMTSSYMGCPAGSRIIFQTKPSPTGNVAGWHGQDVIYSGGIFTLSNGTTVFNGIAVDKDGRVWDTGSGETISIGISGSSVVSPSKDDTSIATSKDETSVLDTKSLETIVTSKDETVANSTSQNNTTGTSPAPETLKLLPTTIEGDNAVGAAVQLKNLSSAEKKNLMTVEKSGRSTVINLETGIGSIPATVTAMKKGSKPIILEVETDEEGNAQIKTKRNLKGFAVLLTVADIKLDREIVNN